MPGPYSSGPYDPRNDYSGPGGDAGGGTTPSYAPKDTGPPKTGPGSESWKALLDEIAKGKEGLGLDIGALQKFVSELGRYKGQIGALDPTLAGIQNQFGQMAQGNDPYLDQMRTNAVENQRRNLALRGVEGSVAQNELVGTNSQYDTLGLGRRDSALSNQAGVVGQRAGLYGAQAGITGQQAGTTGQISDTRGGIISNAAIPPGLDIGWQAAQNAGKDGGGGGGITVICTVLYERKDLPQAWYDAETDYGLKSEGPLYEGYYCWAKHVARWMRESDFLYALVKPLVLAWAEDIYKRTKEGGRGPWMGRLLSGLGEPMCRYIGKWVIANRARRGWRVPA